MIRHSHYERAISIIEDKYKLRVFKSPTKDITDSSFNRWDNSIHLGIKDKPSAILAALAHELGHYLFDPKPAHRTAYRVYQYSYLTGTTISPRQGQMIMEEENAAWKLGFRFLRENEFPVTKAMMQLKDECVGTHQKYVNVQARLYQIRDLTKSADFKRIMKMAKRVANR